MQLSLLPHPHSCVIACLIQNCSHHKFYLMKKSLIFLSFGHPEGFGLPVAEALACGCAVVGYSGLGGRELFAIAAKYGVGLDVPLGDLTCFVDSFLSIYSSCIRDRRFFCESLLQVSLEIREVYSPTQMDLSLAKALACIEG